MAYPMIYRTITNDLPEDKKLEIDVILTCAVAREELKKFRRSAVDSSGFEVG